MKIILAIETLDEREVEIQGLKSDDGGGSFVGIEVTEDKTVRMAATEEIGPMEGFDEIAQFLNDRF